MGASVGLILLIEEALHHSLFLKFNLLDIHRILPLIINGFKLELKSKLQLLLGLGLVQVLSILFLLVFISSNSIRELLQLIISLMDVHVDYVHFREALEDLPEQVVLELIVCLDIKFLKEVVLSLLVLFVNGRVPT
jgi:hypothetical protein